MRKGDAPRLDQEEFAAQVDAHRGIVYQLAAAYCPAGEERDDVVQEICLQLWRAYPRYDRGRRFSTWMYRVALNTAISFARAARTRLRQGTIALDDSPAASRVAVPTASDVEERAAATHRVLQSLDELDRALVLLYLEDRSYREIAEVLGLSETNVGTKLARLKQQMRRDLARDEENETWISKS